MSLVLLSTSEPTVQDSNEISIHSLEIQLASNPTTTADDSVAAALSVEGTDGFKGVALMLGGKASTLVSKEGPELLIIVGIPVRRWVFCPTVETVMVGSAIVIPMSVGIIV